MEQSVRELMLKYQLDDELYEHTGVTCAVITKTVMKLGLGKDKEFQEFNEINMKMLAAATNLAKKVKKEVKKDLAAQQ